MTKTKCLLLLQLAGTLLLLSLFIPPFSEGWKLLDEKFFTFINAPLKNSPRLRMFWALANHRLADWIEDLCVLGFYIAAVWIAPKEERKKRTAQLIFCSLLAAVTILTINRLVCRDLLKLRRQSPTLILEGAVHLSDYISWIPIKEDSTKSFPGDHATTALMFAFSYAYFVRGRLAFFAILYSIFLCLPRLAAGAHWFSDIFIGSSCIVLFSLSFAFCTPLATKSIERIEKLLSRKRKSYV